MCRWFAYISSSEPCLLEDVLVRPAHSLCKQVNEHHLPRLFHHMSTPQDDATERKDIIARNKFHNQDGFGVACSTREDFGEAIGPRPTLYKTIQPPMNDVNLQSIAANNETLCTLGHIRMATSVVHPFNNHPFQFGRHTFMHNGTLANFTLVRRQMCQLFSTQAFENVHGSTDSEHIAALYMTNLCKDSDFEKAYTVQEMRDALVKAVSTALLLQKDLPSTPVGGHEPSSLNLCACDGERLVALRFRNASSLDDQPPSLYYSTTAGITLNRKYPGHPDGPEKATQRSVKAAKDHGRHVIVASEPTTFDDNQWTVIGKNEIIMVEKDMTISMEAVAVVWAV